MITHLLILYHIKSYTNNLLHSDTHAIPTAQ